MRQWELLCKLGYLGMGIGMGPVFSYCSMLLLDRGFSFASMGILLCGWPISRSVCVPPLAFLADKLGRSDIIVLVCVIISCLSSFLMTTSTDSVSLCIFMELFFATAACLNPLFDQHVLALLGEERKPQWGEFRMMLSIGYGIATPLGGIVADRIGWVSLAITWTAGHALVAFALLMTTRSTARVVLDETLVNSQPVRFRDAFVFVWRDRMLLLYLVEACYVGAVLQAIGNFVFPLASSLGAGTGMMGASITASVATETLVFWKSKQLLSKFNLNDLFFAGLIALAVRCVGYAVMPSSWWILVLGTLHGLSFACVWLASVHLFSQRFPSEIANSGIGLLNTVVWGIGCFIGNAIGGALYSESGPRFMFMLFAVGSVMSFLSFAFAGGLRKASAQCEAKVHPDCFSPLPSPE